MNRDTSREPSEKKEAVLNAVLEHLNSPTSGEKLTISNIAQKIDIGKSTIYEYFESKEDMITSALMLLMEKYEDALLDWETFAGLTFKEAFLTHYRKLLDLSEENRMLQEFTHHPDVALLPEHKKKLLMKKMRKTMDAFQARMMEIFQKGVDEGTLNGSIDQTRRQSIESLIFGSVFAYCDPFNDWDAQSTAEDVYRCIVKLHR